MNQCTFIGRIIKDAELRYASGQTAVCTFTLAVDRDLNREKEAEAKRQGKPTADYPKIVIWGKRGEAMAPYLKKGRLVAVVGSFETGSSTKANGEKQYFTQFNAPYVKFLDNGSKSPPSGQGEGSQKGAYEFDPNDINF